MKVDKKGEGREGEEEEGEEEGREGEEEGEEEGKKRKMGEEVPVAQVEDRH